MDIGNDNETHTTNNHDNIAEYGDTTMIDKSVDGPPTLQEWLEQCTDPDECNKVIRLLLTFSFRDTISFSSFWSVLQEFDVKHDPSTSSYTIHGKYRYDSNELWDLLDQFAVPNNDQINLYWRQQSQHQVSVTGQKTTNLMLPPNIQIPQELQWANQLRQELIFRYYYINQSHFCNNNTNKSMNKIGTENEKNALSQRLRTRRQHQQSNKDFSTSATVTEEGANMFLSKKMRSKKQLVVTNDKSAAINDYKQQQQQQQLQNDSNTTEADEIENEYKENYFQEWKFLLSSNQSLMLYGFGSKLNLLNTFATEQLESHGHVLELDGFNKDLSMDTLLDLLVQYWLNEQEPTIKPIVDRKNYTRILPPIGICQANRGNPKTVNRAIAIARALAVRQQKESNFCPLYIIIHNIEGLQTATAQECLAALVYQSDTMYGGMNCIRLVASMDHVNGPVVLWNDEIVLASFSWIWVAVHTQRPYLEEIDHLVTGTKKRNLATARNIIQRNSNDNNKIDNDEECDEDDDHEANVFSVLLSLAPRLTEALQALAELQLEGKEEWVPYTELLKKCHLNCVVNSDQQLRYFMKELSDQGMVQKQSGSSLYTIPFSDQKIREILEHKGTK